jgi:predicted site-specific integrase-resolvase
MIAIKGVTYLTTVDAAAELGVSTKTIRSYMRKGIIPQPPTIRYGVRVIPHFPPEYMKLAKKNLEIRQGK